MVSTGLDRIGPALSDCHPGSSPEIHHVLHVWMDGVGPALSDYHPVSSPQGHHGLHGAG